MANGSAEAVVRVSRALASLGIVGAFEGNVSVREGDRIWVTPSQRSKAQLVPDDILEVTLDGEVVGGTGRPTSELTLHLACYRARDDIAAVIHTHAPCLTAFACAATDFEDRSSTEMQGLFGEIPCARYGLPGTDEVVRDVPLILAGHDAFLLAHHGVVTVGRDADDALAKMVSAELLARTRVARAILFPTLSCDLPAEELARLAEIRRGGPRG